MKPPKCQFCGKEEWRHVCGDLEDIASSHIKSSVVAPSEKMEQKTGRPGVRVPFDRKGYQREYMRKYRARKKT